MNTTEHEGKKRCPCPRARPGTAGLWRETAEWTVQKLAIWAYLMPRIARQATRWANGIRVGSGSLPDRCRRVSASMARFARRCKVDFDASMARSLSHALSDSPRTGNPRLRSPR